MKEAIHRFMTEKHNRIKIAVFFLVLVLNVLTVKTSDDLGYSINHGLIDIFRQEYIQYMTWTGRSVAHIIARCFLALPKGIFNLFNAFIFCLQIELIARHAVIDKNKVTTLLYALIAAAVFLIVPFFGQTVLWETGSCNYLWTTTIILAFLYPYRKAMTTEESKPVWFTVCCFLAGIIAGWTNENTGGACIMLVLFFMGYRLVKHKKIDPWMITGLVGAVIGFVLMIKAPGNAIRSADFVNEGGKAYVLVHDLLNTIKVFSETDGQRWLWLGFGLMLGMAYLLNLSKEKVLTSIAYLISGAAAVCAIVLSPVPVLYDRSMYGATILVITGCAVLFVSLLERDRKGRVFQAGVLTLSVLAVLSLFVYARAIVDLGYTRYQYMGRESWVSSQKAQGNLNPTIPAIYSEFFTKTNPMYGLNDILDYPSFVNNENYAITHGLESVTSTTLEKWNLLYRNGSPELMNLVDLNAYLNALGQNSYYTAFIICNTLDPSYRPYLEILADHYSNLDLLTATNFIGRVEAGKTDFEIQLEPFGRKEDVNGHYVWISSADDPAYTDILIDGNEYTNDNEGISIVVFNRETGTIADSVTWNFNYGVRGTRSYLEK